MFYDVHVHVAELHRHPVTDRFLGPRSNFYVRLFRKQLNLSTDQLAHPHVNELVRQRLIGWASQSSIQRFVLLAMDEAYDEDGNPDIAQTRWRVDNPFVADLARADPSFLYGASIHPYRKDALQELEHAAQQGACLIKWIPSAQRIRLDDPRSTAFYELLAHLGMPLLVHTGNEHASSRKLNDWNDPTLLIHPLRRGVKVIAAHCAARVFLHERCGFKTFCRMALEHEHLYGDLGAFGIPTRIPAMRKLQKNPRLLAKVVYGSDFPTVSMARWFIFHIGRKGVRQILNEANPLQRPYLLMRIMGFPDEVFQRAGRILRLPTRE